ncbi:MAG: methylated-DNA--[protein]-cysteine S-methyltransferase [Deltaproteobacteria bacterium]|jgi:methylated-DNA-[protein]-cysteine S-methyltransferase|nr:methylated-DNA--[protein]-cysteine S-methyltransferase [Deltaproteobacteria bacterium]
MYYSTTYLSPLGHLTLASQGSKLAGLWLEGQKYHGALILEKAREREELEIFGETKKWLERYFKSLRPNPLELPLAPEGGEFRQRVWDILLSIPYGELTTYGAIAKKLASLDGQLRASARAVGGAVGHNPISIIIPCHRVVGANGSLTGYAGGLQAKEALLKLEGLKGGLSFALS